MSLGAKLKQARLDAQLSQRQLCGETITRNMLSQIENGTARPSMDTLSYLAGRLGKPMSFFLEDAGESLPNLQAITAARDAWKKADADGVLTALKGYQKPDAVFDGEYGLLWNLAILAKANQALEEGRKPYVTALLEKWEDSAYAHLLETDLTLLRWNLDQSVQLPKADALLMAKAEQSLNIQDIIRAQVLLDTCEEKTQQWHFLRGEVAFAQGNYALAAKQFRLAEDVYGSQVYGRLEECYKALGDYKMAYEYACKQR